MSAYPVTTDPTAVVGRRFGAFVIDGLVLVAIPVALFFAAAGIELWERPTNCAQLEAAGKVGSSRTCVDDLEITINSDHYSAATYKPAAGVLAGGVYLLYLVIVEWIVQALTGATLGKAIFGIRTVDEEGKAPGLGKQFIRGLFWWPVQWISCFILIPLISILASKGHRRVGDMVAKTYVVRSSAMGSPIVFHGLTPPAPTATGAAPLGTYPTPTTPPTSPYEPAPAPAATPTPEAPTQPQPAASGPQWDAQRNAYIQWDPNTGRWLTYDDGAAEWKPLDDPPSAPT